MDTGDLVTLLGKVNRGFHVHDPEAPLCLVWALRQMSIPAKPRHCRPQGGPRRSGRTSPGWRHASPE